MNRALLGLALAVSVVTAIAGAIVVVPGVPLLGRATQLGAGPIRWRIDAVAPRSTAATAGLRPGDLLDLDTPYAVTRYRRPGDRIAFTRIRDGARAPVTLVAGAAVTPPQTPRRILVRVFRLVTHLAMCALAFVLLWKRFDDRSARALAWFLVAFGFSLSFEANWFPHAAGAVANVLLDLAIAAMLVAATRFAATIGHVEAPLRGRFAAVSVVVGVAMATSVCTLLALQYGRGWNEPLLLTGWWLGWGVQLLLVLATLWTGLAGATGLERRRLAYVAWTFALGFSGPIVATAGLAITGSASGSEMYERLVAWRLTSIAIPFGFGYAVLRHQVLDLEFATSRAAVYGIVTSILVPAFAMVKIVVDKYAGKSLSAGSIASTVLTVVLLAYFEQITKFIRSALDRTVFRERTRELAALTEAGADLRVLRAPETVMERTIEAVRASAGARGGAIYRAAGSAFVRAAGDEGAAHLVDGDAPDVARLRRTKAALQPAPSFAPCVLVLPMIVHDAIVGLLAVEPKSEGQPYAPDEVAALTTLACDAAAALEALAAADRDAELAALRRTYAPAIG